MIYNLITISDIDYTTEEDITVEKNVSTYITTSSFSATFRNDNGQYSDTFYLNDDVIIKADLNSTPASTKIFKGVIEKIKFSGKGQSEQITISGRDYGAVLQDIVVSPRIFKSTESSEIVKSLMRQNAYDTGITFSNVNTTTTTIDKITFNGVSLFDAINQIAEVCGYYFYVDEDKDLNFKEKDSISSGLTFDNTNITYSNFNKADDDIFNRVKILGTRQLTYAQEELTTGTDNTGSIYTLSAKPYNVKVQLSGATNTLYQPGGIVNIDNPATDDVDYLVDFNSSQVILTSGTAGGDNVVPTGSVMIIDYFRSTPLIKTLEDTASIGSYGLKIKELTNKNIVDLNEATDIAETFISEHKDPITEGTLSIRGISNITPGETCIINIPFHNQDNQTYSIINTFYHFTPRNVFNNEVLSITVNKRVYNFIDLIKEHELRLRSLETSEVESSITNVELFTGSIGISGTCVIINRSIGSTFYFNIPGHDILNSPTALLGDMRVGSSVITL